MIRLYSLSRNRASEVYMNNRPARINPHPNAPAVNIPLTSSHWLRDILFFTRHNGQVAFQLQKCV